MLVLPWLKYRNMKRTRSRQAALQLLFALESEIIEKQNEKIVAEAIRNYESQFQDKPLDQGFLNRILKGLVKEGKNLDKMIVANAHNWKLSRMSRIDRNIIRIAVLELIHMNDIPASVTINEAINLGKVFGTAESGSFVNGIVDSILHRIPDNPKKVASD